MTLKWWAAGIASLGIAGCAMASGGDICPDLSPSQTKIRFAGHRFELQKPEDLRRLDAALGDVDADDDSVSPMKSLIAAAVAAGTASKARCDALVQLAEMADSLDLATRNPTPRRIDVLYAPFLYLDLLHNPIGKGKMIASNLAGSAAIEPSLRDPVRSTFWSRPSDIASRDLYTAFGPIVRVDDEICVYDEPKTSYGLAPGFDMKCRVGIIKVKFGELQNQKRDTEVALTRLFAALGYHVEPNDYSPRILLRYDRRLLLEFNSRKNLDPTITVLGFIPVYHKVVQKPQDPFRYIRSAVMKDGRVLASEDLARALIRPEILARSARASKKLPRGTAADHYRPDAAEFERGLDHLVMDEANVQLRKAGGDNIGPWSWDRLGHSERREVRGAALLFAWTNCFDVRWDNNRLKHDGAGIRHAISDLGNGLGRADNFKVDDQGLVNDFPWTFTEPPVVDRHGRERRPFRIVSYQPVFDNDAFRDMTVDDARWMARLIAQLTERQMQQALIAAGFTSAEVRLYTEKLVSRRDRMIQDLGLESDIRFLRPQGVERVFDYDPAKDGRVGVRVDKGVILHPIESRDLVIRGGRVEPR
ncbi:MAG TPA: hypothetical protein VFW45_10465 [Candidatus Polarisedimenticolia bacterium]|nr:hypothetical protein [Candidatus Polarisedimenticolia bacterium]